MAFYDLTKEKRTKKVADIQFELQESLKSKNPKPVFLHYFSNEDTYIRKAAYLGVGRIYNGTSNLRETILKTLRILEKNKDALIRQTVINAAGEIGMFQFEKVVAFFDNALFDEHHKVRNAVIGSVKKMSQKNPEPVLSWAKQYTKHPEKEIRREICHGIELRGRTHPADILPILKEFQFDETKRVKDTLIHVLGQISYKKGCLPIVISALKTWENKQLILEVIDEIIDVHSEKRYAKFSALTQQQVIDYISIHLNIRL